jgi:hypothetical protein
MDMSYGTVPEPAHRFKNIGGYAIRVGLRSAAGIDDDLLVSVLLKDSAARTIRSLITSEPRFGDRANPVRDDLTLSSGTKLVYHFPGIEFVGAESVYSNEDRYQLLQFQYTGNVMKPGPGVTLPSVSITNTMAQTITHENASAGGTLQLGDTNVAYLLGVEAYQANAGNCGLRLVSERCAAGGWLTKTLAQNENLCHDENPHVDLQFAVNASAPNFNCDPRLNQPGLTYLIYEEYSGLGLHFPLDDLADVCALPAPSFRLHRLRDLRHANFAKSREYLALTAEGYYQDYRSNDPEKADSFAVEVCTLVHGSQAMRQFDWRTAPQQPGAPRAPQSD